ncbi:MAG: hypothetical protein IT382_15345 [Deltaproteobacteria bacterium]|nr:hypothetical protein [Deltaproteobacteria bacterium]
MSSTTRGVGAGIHQADLSRIQNASSNARITMDATEVAGLKAGLTAMAESMISQFEQLKSAGKLAEANKLLQTQKVGSTIDKFVIDVSRGDIALPAGTKATDVVGDAVAAFLKAGFTYEIDFKPGVGSHTMTASLQGNRVEWDESTGR